MARAAAVAVAVAALLARAGPAGAEGARDTGVVATTPPSQTTDEKSAKWMASLRRELMRDNYEYQARGPRRAGAAPGGSGDPGEPDALYDVYDDSPGSLKPRTRPAAQEYQSAANSGRLDYADAMPTPYADGGRRRAPRRQGYTGRAVNRLRGAPSRSPSPSPSPSRARPPPPPPGGGISRQDLYGPVEQGGRENGSLTDEEFEARRHAFLESLYELEDQLKPVYVSADGTPLEPESRGEGRGGEGVRRDAYQFAELPRRHAGGGELGEARDANSPGRRGSPHIPRNEDYRIVDSDNEQTRHATPLIDPHNGIKRYKVHTNDGQMLSNRFETRPRYPEAWESDDVYDGRTPNRDQKPPNGDNRPAHRDERPLNRDERPPNGHNRPPHRDGRPPNRDDRPPNGDNRPPHSDGRPPNSDERPPNADNRPPNIDDRPPNVANKPPHRDGRPRNRDERPPNADNRPPNIDDRPPNGHNRPPHRDGRPPNRDDRPPNGDNRPPHTDGRPPNSDERPPNADNRPPNSDDRPPNVANKPPHRDGRPRNRDERPPNGDNRPPNRHDRPPNRYNTPNKGNRSPIRDNRPPNEGNKSPNKDMRGRPPKRDMRDMSRDVVTQPWLEKPQLPPKASHLVLPVRSDDEPIYRDVAQHASKPRYSEVWRDEWSASDEKRPSHAKPRYNIQPEYMIERRSPDAPRPDSYPQRYAARRHAELLDDTQTTCACHKNTTHPAPHQMHNTNNK